MRNPKREENEKEQDRIITDNKMGMDGAKAIGKVLKVNTTLRELSMHSEKEGMKINRKLMMPSEMPGNGLGEEGAKILSEILKVNTTLKVLDLDSENEKRYKKEKERRIMDYRQLDRR